MHFFYLDETGCTGADLTNLDQPIFVLGGICVRDEGWRQTTQRVRAALDAFFGGRAPVSFELHAHELVNGTGPFVPYARDQRNKLAHTILDIIVDRSHSVHLVGIDKRKLAQTVEKNTHNIFTASIPYLLGFNYMISYIEKFTKDYLGRSARGMIILDTKDAYQDDIDAITHFRRYDAPRVRQLKWLVEFSYPVDSMKHPMIQVSDLVIFLAKKFLEFENGYRPDWNNDARKYFASCYDKIISRVKWKSLVDVGGAEEAKAHAVLKAAHSTHRNQWKRYYGI